MFNWVRIIRENPFFKLRIYCQITYKMHQPWVGDCHAFPSRFHSACIGRIFDNRVRTESGEKTTPGIVLVSSINRMWIKQIWDFQNLLLNVVSFFCLFLGSKFGIVWEQMFLKFLTINIWYSYAMTNWKFGSFIKVFIKWTKTNKNLVICN